MLIIYRYKQELELLKLFNVKNSGTGTVQTNFEDTVTFNDATGTNKAIVVKATCYSGS